jgi:hypothetical protein
VAFFVSSVYLLAQANIQAIEELQKAEKGSDPKALKTKATKATAKKVQ